MTLSNRSEGASVVRESPRILIVEDESNVRLVFRTALVSQDYLVTSASDADLALRWLEEESFDLIFLDLRMPGTGGLEMLRRARDAGIETPVVIVSAYDDVANVVQAMRLGAVDFLPKPTTPAALRQVAIEVLARRARQDATPPSRTKPDRNPMGGSAAESLARAKGAITRRAFDEAEAWLREAITRDDRCAEGHYLLGVLHESRNNWDAAYAAHLAALQADPEYLPAQFHLMRSLADKLG